MKKICFVIMGYGKKTDYLAQKTYDLDKTYKNIIKPAVEKSGYECVRGDEVAESGIIDRSMYSLLIHSDLVIADITTFNPNALYELGIRHAAKPFSTIIMKDEDGSIPFDLNHNKIFHYKHMGDDIGVDEANRCIKHLENLISSLEKSKAIDSPMFEFIQSAQPHTLPEEDYLELIKELAEKDKHIFALVERAKYEMSLNNFEEASKLWEKARKRVDNEPYFVQQLALCTYKSKLPSERTALNDALNIISVLEPENKITNDPETLGIIGAIYKRLWLLDKDMEYLNRAIEYYGKGFKVLSDYYNGENYALCLDLKSKELPEGDEKTYYKIEAKKTRESIIEIINDIFSDEYFESRNDIKWIYATMAVCSFATGNEDIFVTYKKLFLEKADSDWEIETFEKSIEHINNLKI